jgi:WD40 repeat protein
VAWNHDDSNILSGSYYDTTIKIWDCRKSNSDGRMTWKLSKSLTGHSRTVFSVSWNHDGSQITSGSWDKTVMIWNAITGDLMKILEGHSKFVRCVAWSPDDRKIASCSEDGNEIIIWNALTGQEINTIQLESVCSLTWSSDGNEIACNDKRQLKVFSGI